MSRQPQGNSHSQPAPRVGNLYRHRRDAVPVDRGSGSGTQRTETGSSHSTRTMPAESCSSRGTRSSGRSSSPPQSTRRLLSRPSKRPRRSTLQTTAYTDPDAQPQIDTVRVSDDSSDEYQTSRRSDQTESDTEPDAEDNDFPDDDTAPGTRRRSRTAERRQANNRVSTVRVSTTSGSQGAAPVRRTLAAPRRIIQGSAYTPPTFTSSSVPPYSSPLATHSATTSAARSSSPPGDLSTPRHEHIWPGTNSRRNTATGAEAAVIARAKILILRYTLFVNPLPAPASLMSEVHRCWLKALDDISDAGNIEASEAGIKIVSGR